MESRLLEACIAALATHIAPRVQIIDAGSPGPDRCDLLLERPTEERKRARLVLDLAPARACLYVGRPAPSQYTPNPFHRSLIGQWIVGADRPTEGPLLRLLLNAPGDESPTHWLVFEWLGGRPEAILIDSESRTVQATLREDEGPHASRRARGATYHWPPPPRRPAYGEATQDQIAALCSETTSARTLSRGHADLPLFLAYEAANQGGGDPTRTAEALRRISNEPFEPTLYQIKDRALGLPACFVSPIALPSLEEHRNTRPGSLFHLLEHAHEAVLRAEEQEATEASFLRLLQTEEQRLMRLHKRLSAESEEAARAKLIRRQAECLLVHIDEIPRGAAQFTSADPANPKATLTIDLDPASSVSANAKRLFRRARRLDRGEPIRRRRLKAIEEAIARLSVLRERCGRETTKIGQKGGTWLREALGKFVREPVIEGWEQTAAAGTVATRPQPKTQPRRAPKIGTRKEVQFHPRRYKTSQGWTVLVGRSNAENDHVTHALAHSEDYWFHAEGCAGSHVVLKREGRRDNPSGKTIRETAEIAAYFSKARTSKKAPVVYTLKKYVRKPRKGAPGLALVTHETMIMVEPKAPERSDPGGWGDTESDD